MKIAYFHQHFSTPRGATGTRSYEFARQLIDAGHDVTIYCGSMKAAVTGLEGPYRRGVRRGMVDGIEVVEIHTPYSNYMGFWKRSFAFFRYSLRAMWMALRDPYDLLFATSTPLTAGLPGMAARWLRHKPFVFEVRDLWPELPREMGVVTNPLALSAMGLLEWASYRSARHVIGLSPGIVEGIRRRGVPATRTSMIPNGCDLELFDAAGTGGEVGALAGVGPDDFVALFAGAHGEANGLDNVLDAAAVLAGRDDRRIKLVFVGDGKRKPELQERAAREGLDNCIFLDPVPKDQLARMMNGADAGLMILRNVDAFYYGTSPNKFFDYIAAARPVLVNYPGWIADLITEHRFGVAVPPDEPEAFADALTYLATLPVPEYERLQRNARSLAERFDRKRLGARFVAVLEGAVNDPTHR